MQIGLSQAEIFYYTLKCFIGKGPLSIWLNYSKRSISTVFFGIDICDMTHKPKGRAAHTISKELWPSRLSGCIEYPHTIYITNHSGIVHA